jgi:hypothetical protein
MTEDRFDLPSRAHPLRCHPGPGQDQQSITFRVVHRGGVRPCGSVFSQGLCLIEIAELEMGLRQPGKIERLRGNPAS